MNKYLNKEYTVRDIRMLGVVSDDFGCIYMIKNVDNGMCYIGQTYNFVKRSRSHIGLSIRNNGLFIDKEIYKSPMSFRFSVVETYDSIGVTFRNRQIRTVKEHEYIGLFNTKHPHGYNMSHHERLRTK